MKNKAIKTVIALVIFFFGFAAGDSGNIREIEKIVEVPVETIVEKEVHIESVNEDQVKELEAVIAAEYALYLSELKRIDDSILLTASEGFYTVSDAFTNLAAGDLIGFEKNADKFSKLESELTPKMDERNRFIQEHNIK